LTASGAASQNRRDNAYLEVASSDEPLESPLSKRDYEFQVKNPDGMKSEWVAFCYPFDDALLDQVRRNSLERVAGKATEAIEPLRKAYVFADRMLGVQHSETLRARAIWEEARDKAALAKLRFREGARVKVLAGPHAGKSGIVQIRRYMLHAL